MILTILQIAMSQSAMSNIFLIGMMVVAFIFFVFLPQRKKQKEAKNMMDNLKVGDKVVTAGGFNATIVAIEEKTVSIEIARGVNAKLEKTSITSVVPKS